MDERKSKAVMDPADFKRVRVDVLDMSQPELGARMGLSYLSIYRYESGDRPISKDRKQHLEDIVALRKANVDLVAFREAEESRVQRRRARKRIQKRNERKAKRGRA